MPVVVRGAAELAEVVAENPFPDAAVTAPKLLQVTFLSSRPPDDVAERVRGASQARLRPIPKRYRSRYRAGMCTDGIPQGIHASKLARELSDRKLGVTATARNWTTVTTLLEMASRRCRLSPPPIHGHRRLHRHAAGRQPARGLHRGRGGAQPADARGGARAAPLGDGLPAAGRRGGRRDDADLHSARRAAVRRAPGAGRRLRRRRASEPRDRAAANGRRRRPGRRSHASTGRSSTGRWSSRCRRCVRSSARASCWRRSASRDPVLPLEIYRNGPTHVMVGLADAEQLAAARARHGRARPPRPDRDRLLRAVSTRTRRTAIASVSSAASSARAWASRRIRPPARRPGRWRCTSRATAGARPGQTLTIVAGRRDPAPVRADRAGRRHCRAPDADRSSAAAR